MRYTEARLTETAARSARRHRRGHRRFPPQLRRPRRRSRSVLPAAFPNLLANGSSGIAVGMATNIPPHNVDELCAALLHLIKHPNATIEKLVEMVPGPDFPDRRHHRRAARGDPRGLQDRPRRLPPARQVGEGGHRPRHLPDRRHRDSLPGAEGQAGRDASPS